MTVLLDTHALLWWQAGGARLSRTAAATIEAAPAVLVSPLSCWEVATLRRLGRIELDREPTAWVADLFRTDRLQLAPLSAEAAALAGQLDDAFPGDPIDRLLYATAWDLRVPLVTKDEALREYARARREVSATW